MLKKNELIELDVESLSSDGNGVAHYNGVAVFVPFSAAGERVRAQVVKVMPRYAFAIIDSIIKPSAQRVSPQCPVFGRCGGCAFQHIEYAAELAAKTEFVRAALQRIGGIDAPVSAALPAPAQTRYRNKVQLPVGGDGKTLCCGFFAPRSHRIVPVGDCLLQPQVMNRIAARCCALLGELGLSSWDEHTRRGIVRHLLLRRSEHSGEIMLCVVVAANSLPRGDEFCARIVAEFPEIKSIYININKKDTNVILGERSVLLYGNEHIYERIGTLQVAVSPGSFLQVNTTACRLLYSVAAKYADLRAGDTLLDLYCGAGTVGLSMMKSGADLVGVEIVPSSVRDAKENAAAAGFAEAEFICADAGAAAAELCARGRHIDVVVTDPPRKGCDERTLSAIAAMQPRRVVMISCNPATLARDLKTLGNAGYRTAAVQPVDMFPRTVHVETCVLLSHKNS